MPTIPHNPQWSNGNRRRSTLPTPETLRLAQALTRAKAVAARLDRRESMRPLVQYHLRKRLQDYRDGKVPCANGCYYYVCKGTPGEPEIAEYELNKAGYTNVQSITVRDHPGLPGGTYMMWELP